MEPTMEAEARADNGQKSPLGPVVQIDAGRIQAHLDEVVRATVEEALIEMYLAGVSVRRVEDITQALWGTRVSASTVSDLNQKIYGKINEWLERPLVGDFPYVYLDGIWLKRSSTPRTKTCPRGPWLGRRSKERCRAGGHRRGAEWLSGDSGGQRGHQWPARCFVPVRLLV